MLEGEYDVIRWDKAMLPNKSTLDCLIENAIKVDEAIFIGTGDDMVLDLNGKRPNKVQHRDNVIFELGLFLGMLGRHDCLYLVDNNSLKDLMSDYKGITVFTFAKDDDKSLSNAISEIKCHFAKCSIRDISLFPSASLAAAYFKNFIQPIFRHYANKGGKIIADDNGSNKKYKKCSIIIGLPKTITDDINAQADEFKRKFTTTSVSIEYLGRQRTLIVDVDSTKKGNLNIIDFPTIISGIHHAVHALLPNEHTKNTPDYSAILTREIQRFRETLELYISQDACRSIPVEIRNENDIITTIEPKRKRIRWIKFRK